MELSETPKSFCGRQIQPQVDLSVIKGWLDFCDNNHKALCKQESNPQIPQGFQVIDCLNRKIVSWENVTHTHSKFFASFNRGCHSLDNKSRLPVFMDRPVLHSQGQCREQADTDPEYGSDIPTLRGYNYRSSWR